ncbi:MAG: PD-(D/E)XK nuclease family protein [Candidatus Pseudobacter hemicellulosilyticus]|uniref:PD-(D/E)XK nuclease family protein n=1 Tax=Candidatus Pseudobacter hemicellulosilyticus TaxID=3121375 RepID=A0AAJ5WRW4_9BACT|nr:MAG: PD-(D/E)XK nuclease family protein [Pseudobacter sp.]
MPTISALKTFLDQATIPIAQKRERTFLDISGFPHYELVISNWYAYFLKDDEDHGMGGLLIVSLLELINEKIPTGFSVQQYQVYTEVSTINQKRIDILINGAGMDEGKYIIIENKVYHWLHNDLQEYWDHCPAKPSMKVGIVLSLTPASIAPALSGKFINILHIDLIERLWSKASSISTSRYLFDFANAIKNLYKDFQMNDEIQFYFNNLEACNKIYDIGDKAYEYIADQIRISGEKLGLRSDRKGDYYRCLYDPLLPAVYYTVTFEKTFEKNKCIFIILELWKEGLALLPRIDREVGSKAVARGLTIGVREHKGLWKHFALREYPITMDDLHNLSTVVETYIKRDLEATYLDIKNILQEHATN